jgi:IstB-like ATP binding protein
VTANDGLMGNVFRQGRLADSVGADHDGVGGIVEEFERHLIDRLVHHAEIIAIDGESYRLKEAAERSEKRGRQRRGAKP